MKIFVCQNLANKKKECESAIEKNALQTLVHNHVINPTKYDIVHGSDYSENGKQFDHCLETMGILKNVDAVVFTRDSQEFAEGRILRSLCDEYGISYYEVY